MDLPRGTLTQTERVVANAALRVLPPVRDPTRFIAGNASNFTPVMPRAMTCVDKIQVKSRAQLASLPRNRPEKFYNIVVQVANHPSRSHRRPN